VTVALLPRQNFCLTVNSTHMKQVKIGTEKKSYIFGTKVSSQAHKRADKVSKSASMLMVMGILKPPTSPLHFFLRPLFISNVMLIRPRVPSPLPHKDFTYLPLFPEKYTTFFF
jgi:hypothetical protein